MRVSGKEAPGPPGTEMTVFDRLVSCRDSEVWRQQPWFFPWCFLSWEILAVHPRYSNTHTHTHTHTRTQKRCFCMFFPFFPLFFLPPLFFLSLPPSLSFLFSVSFPPFPSFRVFNRGLGCNVLLTASLFSRGSRDSLREGTGLLKLCFT